jgi:hypothetical protein
MGERMNPNHVEFAVLRDKFNTVVKAAVELRRAQTRYMANRGDESLGKAVGEAARNLDQVLKSMGVELDY